MIWLYIAIAVLSCAVIVLLYRYIRLKSEIRKISGQLEELVSDNSEKMLDIFCRKYYSEIFADAGLGMPPAGTGECAAPKLLDYAFKHALAPLCMGEFWPAPPATRFPAMPAARLQAAWIRACAPTLPSTPR